MLKWAVTISPNSKIQKFQNATASSSNFFFFFFFFWDLHFFRFSRFAKNLCMFLSNNPIPGYLEPIYGTTKLKVCKHPKQLFKAFLVGLILSKYVNKPTFSGKFENPQKHIVNLGNPRIGGGQRRVLDDLDFWDLATAYRNLKPYLLIL